MSVYVGDELSDVISALIQGTGHSDATPGSMDIGVTALPPIPLDNSDRNRTSPFAFTGNKFEFRMPGSSFNIACPNIMLNCAVAESLGLYAGELEQAKDFDAALSALIRRELSAHSRILFNGNGYGADWPEEAARRGLMNLHNTPEALEHFDDAKNVALFTSQGIYTPEEIHSRQEIAQEEYAKTILIEARTSLDILHKQIIPACIAYSTQVAQGAAVKSSIGVSAEGEIALVRTITDKTSALMERTEALDKAVAAVPEAVKESARYCAETVLPAMEAARAIADQLELLVDRAHWPFPTYRDLLFYV